MPTLTTIATIVQMLGHRRVNPSVYFRPIAQPTSSKPAMNRMIQAMSELCLVLADAMNDQAIAANALNGLLRLVHCEIASLPRRELLTEPRIRRGAAARSEERRVEKECGGRWVWEP